RLNESSSSFGSVVLCFFNASAPAKCASQLILTPEALTISRVGPVTSGPIPSPGINVMICFMSIPRAATAQLDGRFSYLMHHGDESNHLGNESLPPLRCIGEHS